MCLQLLYECRGQLAPVRPAVGMVHYVVPAAVAGKNCQGLRLLSEQYVQASTSVNEHMHSCRYEISV